MTTEEMSITYKDMHCKCLINPPRHVIDKYLIAMHFIIWRHPDNIWRTSDAARSGSTGFQRWKLYFIVKLGIMNKYFMEYLFKHNVFTRGFFSEEFRWYVEMPYLIYWRVRICLRKRGFTRAYTQQIVITNIWT